MRCRCVAWTASVRVASSSTHAVGRGAVAQPVDDSGAIVGVDGGEAGRSDSTRSRWKVRTTS